MDAKLGWGIVYVRQQLASRDWFAHVHTSTFLHSDPLSLSWAYENYGEMPVMLLDFTALDVKINFFLSIPFHFYRLIHYGFQHGIWELNGALSPGGLFSSCLQLTLRWTACSIGRALDRCCRALVCILEMRVLLCVNQGDQGDERLLSRGQFSWGIL